MQPLHHFKVFLCNSLHLSLPHVNIQALILWHIHSIRSMLLWLESGLRKLRVKGTLLPLEISNRFFIKKALFLLISFSLSTALIKQLLTCQFEFLVHFLLLSHSVSWLKSFPVLNSLLVPHVTVNVDEALDKTLFLSMSELGERARTSYIAARRRGFVGLARTVLNYS